MIKHFVIIPILLCSLLAHGSMVVDSHRFTSAAWDFDSLGSDIGLWLDSADTSTLWQTSDCSTTAVSSDGDTVECWEDKSPNGFQFIHSTSTQTYETSELNGEPIIRFSGATYLMHSNNTVRDLIASDGNTYTAFFVYKTSDTQHTMYWFGSGSASDVVEAQIYSSSPIYSDSGNNGTARTTATTPSGWNGNYHILMTRRDGTTDHTIRADGSDLVVDTTVSGVVSDTSTHDLAIGARTSGGFRLTGDVAFIIVYKDALSGADITAVEDELNDRYNVF